MRKFQGAHTALITPFCEDGSLNEPSLRQNIRFQLDSGIDGLVILGTTGETPTLTADEKLRVIEIAMDENRNKKTFLTIGTGSYSTAETMKQTKFAESLNADCALIVTPYYNKPTQEGLFQHFQAVAKSVDIPILVYNIAGRTGQNLTTATLKRLSAIENIIGVKEASGNVLQMMDVYADIIDQRPDFCLISGDDALTLPLMAIGGCGVISVLSNLLPSLIKQLTNYLQQEEFVMARKLHYQLLPLIKAIFIETNPMPIKAAMNYAGMQAGPCRLPLCDLLEENKKQLKTILEEFGALTTCG